MENSRDSSFQALRKEILRRIDALPKITYEPKMLRDDFENEETNNCIFLLRAGTIERESPAYRDALQRIYWICYIIDR